MENYPIEIRERRIIPTSLWERMLAGQCIVGIRCNKLFHFVAANMLHRNDMLVV